MLAIQLKNLIKDVPDMANIKIYVNKVNETRQLRRFDLDFCQNGDVVIDAEYVAPVKKTIIKKEDMR